MWLAKRRLVILTEGGFVDEDNSFEEHQKEKNRMENAKEDLVGPLEQHPSGRFRTHHNVCQYPIGIQDGKDMFCDCEAVQEVEGYLFCSLHAPMAERGCLDHEYSDGTTPRGIIASRVGSR